MSLTVDGVWKAGVWATTVWADGVWREGPYTPPTPEPSTAFMLYGGGAARVGRRAKKREDDELRDQLAAAFESFEEAPAAIQEEVKQVVAPYAKTEGNVVRVDISQIVRRVQIVERLLDLESKLARARRAEAEDEADVEFILLNA